EKTTILFYISLFLNYLWPIFFFTFGLKTVAFVIILLLIYIVIKWLMNLMKDTKLGFYLQIPYLLWLFFALYLNLAIIILN
ncbi:MAG: tryptophan-rich sensory protein, partial [Firmicutes bacterium]|nr:tryptophan-rich sensory protein [Bacillota bacterium]